MIKKFSVITAFIFLFVGALPLIGNSTISKVIDNRIVELGKHGVVLSDKKINSTYTQTKAHYIFKLEDSKKFAKYLGDVATSQVTPLANTLLDGIELGVDLSYSNVPVMDSVKIDIYPLTLSDEIKKSLALSDAKLLAHIEKMLKNKSLFYHLDYDIKTSKFSGYVKDIDEKFTLSDGTKTKIELKDAKYVGKGSLLTPNILNSSIKKINLTMESNGTYFEFNSNNLVSKNKFLSKNSYDLFYVASKIELKTLDANNEKYNVALKDIEVSSKSNVKKELLDGVLNFKVSNISSDFNSTKSFLNNLDFVMSYKDIDYKSYELVQKLMQSGAQDAQSELKSQNATYELLAKGFNVKIDKFNVDKLSIDGSKTLKAFSIDMDLNMKADKDLKAKMQISPTFALANIDINSNFKFSKDFYTMLLQFNPMVFMVDSMAKKSKDSVEFNVKYKTGQVSVNGQSLGQQ